MGSQGGMCGFSRVLLRRCLRLANVLIFMGGLVLLGVGIWTLQDKSFPSDLIRNSLYLNTARVLTAVGVITTLISVFGFYSAQKEVKVLHLTYFVLISVLLLVLGIGAVLAYVFIEQVELTMKAEMISDVRLYDPDEPSSPITWAWHTTQSKLECCGMVTPQVNTSWEIWRYNPILHPQDDQVWSVPLSCCMPDVPCGIYSDNITNIYTKDCYDAVKEFVSSQSAILGGVAVTVVGVQVLGIISSLALFLSIV
eukprot:TRINITY_DN11489_c0_g1_i1.p1 TRINITY_DN11489_c0_g1~~TRINITY_DN11489_c0_g1_i1.p1  ORF type:complete len:253 (-),score=35.16 TRINITY_DN11489_c0_g1_i1:594-1352(-)